MADVIKDTNNNSDNQNKNDNVDNNNIKNENNKAENADNNKGNNKDGNDSLVDETKTKQKGVSEYLKNLGLSDEDLRSIVDEHNKQVEANKSDLDKEKDNSKKLAQQLLEERKGRERAEAKLLAISLGVIPKLVDDFIVVALSKVTEDKEINEVVSEMKKSETSSFYFEKEEDKDSKKKETKVTRKRVTKNNNNDEKSENNDDDADDSSVAKRILKSRSSKGKKSSFFS